MTTAEQRLSALDLANRVRLGGSEVRREVAAGVLSVSDALDDPRAQGMPIGRLLLAQPRWGQQKAGRLLKQLTIWPQRPVRDLTDRQRRLIRLAVSR
jgi:hypothetical protein